jgi:HEAT repeat protein
VQSDIVKLLVQFKDKSFDILINALQNENSMVRRQALIALGKIGDVRAIEPITALLNDPDPGVKFYIPISLELIGGESIVSPLNNALENQMSQVRMTSANILGKMKDATSVNALINLLADDSSYIRASATDALIAIGSPSIPSLIEVMQKKAENVTLRPSDFVGDKIGTKYKKELAKRANIQAYVAAILGTMKSPTSILPLLDAMKVTVGAGATEDEKSYSAIVRTSAVTALGIIGSPTVKGLLAIALNKDETETARVNAISVLGTILDKRAVMPLITTLKDENKSVRAVSAASLGSLKDRRALTPLIDALQDNDIVTKTNAATSLGLLIDNTATQPLLGILNNKDEREKLRTAAMDSLGLIKDAASLESILKVLIDEYEKDGIRKSAATALRLMENVYPSEALVALLNGEIVYPIIMPEKGNISKWLKQKGDKELVKGLTPVVEVKSGVARRELVAPDSGTLIKIYITDGQSAEAGAILGLIAFKDNDIKEEERSSIRNMASLALGKVKGENAVPALIEALKKDKNGAVRKNAASSLRETENAKARPALIYAMKHDDSGPVRSEAAYALGFGALKNVESVPSLIDTMQKDKYESARLWATWSLGELVDKRAVEPMIKTLVEGRNKGEKEAPAVITQVINALVKLATPAFDPLIAVLKDKDVDEVPKSYVVRILGLIGNTKAVEPLIDVLKDNSVVVRSEATKALGLISDRRATVSLIDLLTNKNEWITVRINAASLLGSIKDERAVMPLIDELKSDITSIRSNAVVALGNIKDKRAVPLLVQIMENPKEDDAIRANAVTALDSIGDLRTTPAILNALKSDNVTIRQNAVVAVGDISIKESVDTLIAIVGNLDELTALRASAAESLGKIGDKKAITILVERLGDPDEFDSVWIKVAEATGKLKATVIPERVELRARDTLEPVTVINAALMAMSGTGGGKDFATLIEMLDSATVAIRYGSALALGNTGRKDAVQPLITKLQKDVEEAVRLYAARAIATIADPSSEQALIKAFKEDATASVKNESAIALGNIKGKAGIAALISVVQDNTKANDHRWNSAIALGNAKATEAISALQTALADNNGTIHYESAEALRKITGQNQGYER